MIFPDVLAYYSVYVWLHNAYLCGVRCIAITKNNVKMAVDIKASSNNKAYIKITYLFANLPNVIVQLSFTIIFLVQIFSSHKKTMGHMEIIYHFSVDSNGSNEFSI